MQQYIVTLSEFDRSKYIIMYLINMYIFINDDLLLNPFVGLLTGC